MFPIFTRMFHVFDPFFMTGAFVSAGILAVSIPIIIHLFNRRRFRTITWAAMEFLLRAMKKNRKRLRFEQWLLLAVRCLLIFLLGMALAQFAGCDNKSKGGSVQRPKLDIYIVDNSYSTAYTRDPDAGSPDVKTHLDKAKQLVKKWLEGGNKSVIITTAKPVAAVISEPESKSDVSIAAVDRIEQSWSSADLKKALGLALESAGKDKSNDYDKRLFIVTHSTRAKWDIADNTALKQIGSQLASVFTQITPVNLADGQQTQWNGAILDIQPTSHLVSTKFWVDFRADVRGYFPKGDTGHATTVEWLLDDQPIQAAHPLNLDGAATPLPQTVSDVLFKAGGFHVLTARLDDKSDHLQVDNIRHRVVDVASELKVLLVEGTSGGDQFGGVAHFFETAIKLKDSHYLPGKISPSELRQKALNEYVAVALVNVPEISPEESDDLAAFVRQGGELVIFMGGAVKQNEYNSLLYERHSLLPGKMINAMSYHREDFKLTFPPGVTGGEFRLTFNGTASAPIAFSTDAKKTAANIQSQVATLTGIPATTVVPDTDNLTYTIMFTVNGRRDVLPQEQASVDSGRLQGSKAVVIESGKVIDGSNFDFKPNSVLHPLLKAFANHQNTGLDTVATDKYWQVDPDYLVNLVKGFHDSQARIIAECDAATAGAKALPPQLISDQTKLSDQVRDLFVSFRELSDAPADGRDPSTRVPAAVTRLLTAGASQTALSRDDQEAVKVLLDGITKRLEANKPERILNYLPMKPNSPSDPAITAQSVGRGRVMFVSTSANQEWTDFPNDASYPQLMFELLDGSLRSRDAWMNLVVGDRLAIPVDVRGASVPTLARNDTTQTTIAVFPPERTAKNDAGAAAANESQDEEWRTLYHTEFLSQPGRYTLTLGARKLPIVVNVPANAEADVTTVENDAISVAMGGVKMEDRVTINNPDRDYFGWLTLILVLMLAGFECFIAWKFGHHRNLEGPAGAPGGQQRPPRMGLGLGGPAPLPPPPLPGL